ncbi:MAG: hypothetical protein ABI723_15575 [Bacteroidia bacterium]
MNTNNFNVESLRQNSFDFRNVKGSNLNDRYAKFNDWCLLRQQNEVWPFSRTYTANNDIAIKTIITEDLNQKELINFGSQDYLSLSHHKEIIDAAKHAIDKYGIHSAGAAILTGRSSITDELEKR